MIILIIIVVIITKRVVVIMVMLIVILLVVIAMSEKGEVLLRGVGTLRHFSPPDASVQWQPDGLTIHAKQLPFLLSGGGGLWSVGPLRWLRRLWKETSEKMCLIVLCHGTFCSVSGFFLGPPPGVTLAIHNPLTSHVQEHDSNDKPGRFKDPA